MRATGLAFGVIVGFAGGYVAGHYTGETVLADLCDATRTTIIDRLESTPDLYERACAVESTADPAGAADHQESPR